MPASQADIDVRTVPSPGAPESISHRAPDNTKYIAERTEPGVLLEGGHLPRRSLVVSRKDFKSLVGDILRGAEGDSAITRLDLEKRQEKPTPSPQGVSGLQQQQPRDRFAEFRVGFLEVANRILRRPQDPAHYPNWARTRRRIRPPKVPSKNSDIYSAVTIDAAAPTENGRTVSLHPRACSDIIILRLSEPRERALNTIRTEQYSRLDTARPATVNGNSSESHAGEAPPSTPPTLTTFQENIPPSVDPSPQTQLTGDDPLIPEYEPQTTV
ncbi:hypothetical protein DL768_008872 [Monosporascus sp. mg162]|nr:hypothetical protein DL768_008872 [Monosporascus sp. mg162]